MSVGVSGIFRMKSSSIETKGKFSYNVMQIAYESRLGCKLGGNVSSKAMNNYKGEIDEYSIPFELLDTPLDTTIDNVFCYETYDGQSPSLKEKMSGVEVFLRGIATSDEVEQIILDVNYFDGFKEKTSMIRVDEFAKKIVELYIPESVYIPIIRFVLST